MILVIAQITLGILIFVYQGEAEEIIVDGMKTTMGKYGTGDEALDASIDASQHDLKCCGVMDFNDWKNFTYNGVSDGCCKEMVTGCGSDYFNKVSKPEIYENGCYNLVKDQIEPYGIWMGVLAIGLAIIQLICVSCACGIANKSREYV
jgi:hypothetical protein